MPPKRRKSADNAELEDEQEDDAADDVELLQAMEEVDEAVEASDEAAIEALDLDEMLEARDISIVLDDDERKLAQSAYRKVCYPRFDLVSSNNDSASLSALATAFSTRNGFAKNSQRSQAHSNAA